MAVGAKDYIDQMLVKKYSKEQTNNMDEAANLVISKDRYWEIMREMAKVQMTMIQVSSVIKSRLAGGEKKAQQAAS
jgi:hypothetical protein